MIPRFIPVKRVRATIVTATHDDELNLELWFRHLCQQTVLPEDYEIRIVDSEHKIDYESKLTQLRAESRSALDITYHRTTRGGRARALNHALNLATGNLIIFLVSGFLAPPDFVRAHVAFTTSSPKSKLCP